MKKRDLLANIADKTGLLELFSRHSPVRKHGSLTILAYHRIFENPISVDCNFDEELLSATQDDFDKQVSWLKRYFEIITFEQLKHLETSANYLIITFDDGYRDNYDLAYPVLKKHGVKATIFLSTGYIGAKELFWWDEIAYVIKKTSVTDCTIKLDQDYKYDLGNESKKRTAMASLVKLAKRIPNEKRLELLDQLKMTLRVKIPKEAGKDLILSWADVLEMSKHGIEFGAHSVTHPILANMPIFEMRLEIEDSKEAIEKVTGKEVVVFSYPVGGEDRFNTVTKDLVKEAGYSYAVSYVHGVNDHFRLDRFCLKRLHVEKGDSFSVFKAKLLMPDYIKY